MKKLNFNLYFLSLLLIVLLTSCEEMVTDVDAPAAPQKLVVVGFITPDLPYISVRVYKSRPLYTSSEFTGNYPTVKDAVVKMSNNGKSVNLLYNSEWDCYRIDQDELKVLRGETYYLEVTQGDFNVTASCTVPDMNIPDLEILDVDTVTQYSELYYNVDLRFKDAPGQGQYYHISAASVYFGEGGSKPSLYEVSFTRGDPYVTDKNKDGNYFTYTTDNIYQYPGEPVRMVFTIGLTDENYYQYHKAIYAFEDDNPFSEPSPIFSNINGGLGVFGAYVQNIIVIDNLASPDLLNQGN